MKHLIIFLLLLTFTACEDSPRRRKETIHELYTDHQPYWVTSEIRFVNGCAVFEAWNIIYDDHTIHTYTVCGSYQIRK